MQLSTMVQVGTYSLGPFARLATTTTLKPSLENTPEREKRSAAPPPPTLRGSGLPENAFQRGSSLHHRTTYVNTPGGSVVLASEIPALFPHCAAIQHT